jgi:hypothetical protein
VDCGTVTVLVDRSKPDGPAIQVAPARRAATDVGSPRRVDAVRPGWRGVTLSKQGEMSRLELR